MQSGTIFIDYTNFSPPIIIIFSSTIGKMEVRLSSDASLEIQTGALIEAICPQTDDPARCESLMTEFWPKIGLAMYPVFIEGESLCGAGGLGVCTKRRNLVREWTCEECVKGVNDIGGIITTEETIAAVIAFLKVITAVENESFLFDNFAQYFFAIFFLGGDRICTLHLLEPIVLTAVKNFFKV
jgi:hypothetical protein